MAQNPRTVGNQDSLIQQIGQDRATKTSAKMELALGAVQAAAGMLREVAIIGIETERFSPETPGIAQAVHLTIALQKLRGFKALAQGYAKRASEMAIAATRLPERWRRPTHRRRPPPRIEPSTPRMISQIGRAHV